MGVSGIQELRDGFRGEVITDEDEGYDAARRVYNAMIDRRPAVIVRPANAGDVMAAVDFARENDLPIAVRGGSHSVPGLRHLRRRRRRRPVRRCAASGSTRSTHDRASRGRRHLGRLQRRDATPFGLATTGGIISTTGVGGLTLGGGIGYLARGFGLSCDNLISADVVTADGSPARASEDDERGPVLGDPRRRRQLRRRHLVRVPAAPGQGHLRRPDVLRARATPRDVLRVLPRVHRRRARAARRVPGLPDRAAAAVHPRGPARRTVRR